MDSLKYELLTDVSINFDSINDILRKIFKHEDFKSKLQKDAVFEACKFTTDLFVSLPTGSGKSLIYQLPALYKNFGIVIVISPLVALISNQITNAQKLGIPAAAINSHMSKVWNDKVKEEICRKNCRLRLLYLTPEMLCSLNFRSTLNQMNKNKLLKLFAIDEAHCVSSWGHEFRPDYLKLASIRELFPQVPIVALTATATTRVLEDIIQVLHLKEPKKMVAPSFRKNLFYDVRQADGLEGQRLLNDLAQYVAKCLGVKLSDDNEANEKVKELPGFKSANKKCETTASSKFVSAADLLANLKSSGPIKKPTTKSRQRKIFLQQQEMPLGVGIVYCRTKLTCEELADHLERKGLPARPYHSGLSPKERAEIEKLWMEEDILIICATISFGMGIDKPNVRVVAHFNMSQSLANYYQESGRAGRDGKKAYCRLYYSKSDQNAIAFLLRKDLSLENCSDSDTMDADIRFEQSNYHYKHNNPNQRGVSSKLETARQAMVRFERMVEYCQSKQKCRHLLLAKEFTLTIKDDHKKQQDKTTLHRYSTASSSKDLASASASSSSSHKGELEQLANGCINSCDACSKGKPIERRNQDNEQQGISEARKRTLALIAAQRAAKLESRDHLKLKECVSSSRKPKKLTITSYLVPTNKPVI